MQAKASGGTLDDSPVPERGNAAYRVSVSQTDTETSAG